MICICFLLSVENKSWTLFLFSHILSLRFCTVNHMQWMISDVVSSPKFSLKPKIIFCMFVYIVLLLFCIISFTSYSSKAYLILPGCAHQFFFKVIQISLMILLLRRHAMPVIYHCQALLLYNLFFCLNLPHPSLQWIQAGILKPLLGFLPRLFFSNLHSHAFLIYLIIMFYFLIIFIW